MALQNKSDPTALQKLREKVQREKLLQNKQSTSTKQTNNGATSRATPSSAPLSSNKSDPEAVKKLRQKVAQQKIGSYKTNTIPSVTKPNSEKNHTDFNTEAQNAYTSAKSKTNTKTTLASAMTEAERKARIKEINSELQQLSFRKQGLGRAGVYGTDRDWLAKTSKETQKRIDELSAELKSLERVGTFSSAELKQFEIDDAKAEKKKLPNYNPMARVSPSEVDAFVANAKAHTKLDNEIDTLKSGKELYEDISKFGDVVNDDTFGGQWRANYRNTELNREASKAMNDYIRNPTQENYEIAKAYVALSREYAKNNEKALDDENVKASWLTKSMAGYLPQLKDQIVPELIGGGVGLALGSLLGAPTIGRSIGAGLGVYSQSFDDIRGSIFIELLSMGLDEKTALRLAEDEAIKSAAIEGAETAGSWAIAGIGGAKNAIGKVAKASVANGSKNAVTNVIANMATKATGKAAEKASKAVATPVWKTAIKTAGGAVGEVLSEYGEEFSQGAVSVATREKAMSIIDKKLGRYGEGNIDLYSRPIYTNDDGTISTVDSVTFTVNGKYLVLPTIVRDANGNAKRLESDEEIFAHYEKTGEYLGEFDTLEEANGYANSLHYAQEYYYSQKSTDSDDNLWIGAGKVVADAITGKRPDVLDELHTQGKEGAKIGLMMGGSRITATNIVTHFFNAKTVKLQNEYADSLLKDEKSLKALIEESKASGEGTVSAKVAQEVEQAQANGKVTREQVKRLIKANDVYVKLEEEQKAPTTIEEAAEGLVTERNKPSGRAVLEARKNGDVTEDVLNALTEANVEITPAEVKKVTGFGEEGSRLVADYANVEGKTFSQVLNEVKPSYNSGFQNPDLDVSKMQNAFSSNEQMDAYKVGQADRKMQDLADKVRAEQAVVNKESGFVSENLPSDVTPTQVSIIDQMAKAVGVKAFVKNNLKGNAEIDHSKAEVAIDFNFRRRVEGQNVSIVFHAAHEMAMHRVVELAPEEGKAFVYAMYRHLAGNESTRFTLADAKRMSYGEQGVELSLAQAMEEISANNILYLYNNDETKFHEAIDRIVNGTDAKAKQGLQKYIDYLKKIIRKIRNFLSGKSGAERAKLQAELDEITRLRDMFETAFAKAVERTKALKSENSITNSDKNLEIKTNKEYNGNKSYSLYWHTDLNRTQSKEVEKRLRQVVNHDEKRITDTASWYSGRLNGDDLFVIYSTEYPSNPTILYEVKGKNAKLEQNILTRALEVIGNERSAVEKQRIVNELLSGNWVPKTHNLAHNNDRLGNRGSNIGNASVLQGQSSQFIGSGAFRNVIENLFKKQAERLKNSKSHSLKEKAPTFYSQMGKTIADMKQDKIGANSVVSYLTGRGVKAEEIKWSGIETFLEGKKSVTKAELQEFVAGSMLQIEEQERGETIRYTDEQQRQLERISTDKRHLWDGVYELWGKVLPDTDLFDFMATDNTITMLSRMANAVKKSEKANTADANRLLDYFNELDKLEFEMNRVVSQAEASGQTTTKWDEYKLDGGSNYRELTFTMPNSTYSNHAMQTHWGDNAKGIFAHARIQDFDVDGGKMLFIEEIQSDWHNEGHKTGYQRKLSPAEEKTVMDLTEKRTHLFDELKDVLEEIRVTAERAEKQNLNAHQQVEATSALWDKAHKLREEERALLAEAEKIEGKGDVPDAPFSSNYHEYVLKKLIRTAAEQGYDSIGWTPADIQSKRWSEQYAEGYRIEYDQDIPKFLNKYGKKWGAKVGQSYVNPVENSEEYLSQSEKDIEDYRRQIAEIGEDASENEYVEFLTEGIADLEKGIEKLKGTKVWSMPITESMKQSVLYEGQPMYSLKDSDGKTLSAEQQEYFKDSKVRDANGNLLVVYHGTRNGGFTVFNRNHNYYTDSRDTADSYAPNGALYKGYLNIAKPYTIDAGGSKWSAIPISEEVKKMLDSAGSSTFKERGKWCTSVADIVAAVSDLVDEGEADYDGVIVRNVDDTGSYYKGSDKNIGNDYISFNSEQFKDIDNKKPTNNPDINFSLKESVEETKNLIAVHNMQVSELERTLDLGGLPMPSIAIIKAKSGHSEYGAVSLVFSKNTIDPKANRLNKVYGGDAWTPTYPTIEYKPNAKVAKKISDKYYELSRKFGYDESRPLYNYVYDLEEQLNRNKGEAELLNELYEDTRMMQLYLLDSGKNKVETIKKEISTELTDAEVEMNEFFIRELGADVVDAIMWDGNGTPMAYRENYLSKYEDAIRESYKKLLSEKYQFTDEQVQNVLDSTKAADLIRFMRDAYKYRQNGRITTKTEDDYEATKQAIKDTAGDDYRGWIDSLFKGIEEKSGIRNNVDYFTNSGNRRSWEALHWENNLENVINVMKSQDNGVAALFSGHAIWAVSAKDYRSIDEIKADSDRLKQLSEEEYSEIKQSFGNRFEEIAQSIMSKTESNPFIAIDNAMSCIVEAVRNSKTKSGLLNNLKEYSQLTVTETTIDDIVSLVTDISNMPTEYFEAKPKRAVELNEIATAIIPDTTSEATKARLDDMGIKYLEYEAGNEDARLNALNSLEDVKFSLKENDDISTKDRQKLLEVIEHLKGEFEVTKFAKADPKKLAKMTRDILKEYSSKADFDETYKAIDELYQYMANGEDGHPAVWNDVYNRAYKVAQEIVKNALVVDDYSYQEYKSLRDYLRTTPMRFNTYFDSIPASYENFNEFRRMNMGKLKFTKDGMSIDSVYKELSELYPEFFNVEEETNSADQLETIIGVLDELQPTEVNPFDRQIEEVSISLANDLTSRFFDIPQAKPTFADKANRKVVEERIRGGKKVESVRQQRDEKIKKLLESQKAKTKKQLDKLRKQRDEKIKKEQDKRRNAISKMSEKQKVKVLRAKITRHASDLSKKLVNPTDKQHIPYELQGAVAKLLECINLESNYTYDTESHSYKKNDVGLPSRRTKAFNELKQIYSNIATSVVVDPDLMGEDGLLSDVISLADKRIADMTSSELDTVWQTIRAIEASVHTANKMFSQGKFETILEVAETLKFDNKGKVEKTEFKGIIGKGKKLTTLDMLTPETYFHYLGDAGEHIFRMMRDAQDKHISIMKEVADFTHKELKGVDVNSLEKTVHTVKLGGENVKISTAQLMELYVLMKRNQAVDHILKGGILPDTVKAKGMKDITRAEPVRNVTVEEITKALSNLTDEQRTIADKLQRFVSNVLSAYGNEASMQVYNYEKFNEENYWTIRTNKQEIASDIGKDTAVTSVANKGMAKGTKPHANTSVRIGSIFDTFSAHSSDMATYAAWLGTTEDVNRIRNFVFWEDGVRTGTVKGILDTIHGKSGSQYLEKLLTDISIGVKGTDNMNPFDKFVGNYKAASVGANIRVVIQQPTAILRAMDMINPIYLAEGNYRPLKGWEKAKKYAPIAQWKDWGHFDINTGRQMKDVLFDNASLIEKTKQAGMFGASMMDSLAWGQLWNAVEAETKAKHKDLEVGSSEYYEAVSKRFTEIIDHTQVVDGILQRSQIMRSADSLTKMATSFMGEPTKQYNMALSAMYDAKNQKGDARKKAVGRLGRTALSLVVAGVINACVQSIVDGLRDDDKEKDYWEKWLKAFIGDGEDVKWYESNLTDTFNPLSYIPFAKDIVSIVQGYDVKRMDTETIAKTYSAITNMYKAVTGTGKYTIAEASAQLFAEVARMYGLPVANVKRDVNSIVTTTAIETDSYLMQYRMGKAMLNINYEGNRKNFMDILFNAYNNDREAYEIIYKDMIKSGYDANSIEKGMETRMKKAEGVKKSSDLSKRYMSPKDEKKYDSSLKTIKSSSTWKSADATQRKNAKADLYEFLTSTSEDMEETRAKAEAFGIDETEYTLWQLAKDMANTDGKDGLTKKESVKAIKYLDLPNDTEWDLYLSSNESKGAKYVHDKGIDIDTYADFITALDKYDKPNKNGNYGTYTNEEYENAIRSMRGLSRQEKAILWQSKNPDGSTKNNPWK